METIAFVVAAFIIGVFIGAIVHPKKYYGYLRVDRSDVDGPYLFLELNRGIEELSREKSVSLLVKNEDFLPRQ